MCGGGFAPPEEPWLSFGATLRGGAAPKFMRAVAEGRSRFLTSGGTAKTPEATKFEIFPSSDYYRRDA